VRGTGAHFYNPEITAQRRDGGYLVNGSKSFVTSGGEADVYLILTRSGEGEGLDVLAVEKGAPGIAFSGTWTGIGLAGNQSIRLELRDAAVPAENLVGEEGKGADLVFGVVAPTFLVGVAAVNAGIAYAATDAAIQHAKRP
jgi:alkylation response protein AidB-like acyl-CoA dehydrogenase